MKNSVEIITVSYCTPELLKKLISSIRKVEGDYPIRVIDGSDKEPYITQTKKVCRDVTLKQFGYNIHHGRGMDYGIRTSTHEWCVVVDSDVVLKKPIISHMFVGKMIVGKRLERYERNGCKYDYYSPAFMLINRDFYLKMRKQGVKFVHDGAPCYSFFRYLHEKNMDVCFDIYEHLGINRDDYMYHPHRGTRNKFGDKLKAGTDVK